MLRINSYISTFTDTDLQTLLLMYFSKTNVLLDPDHRPNSEKIIFSIRPNMKMSDIDWFWFQEIFRIMQGKNQPKSAVHFIKYIVLGGYYQSDDADIVNSFAEELNAAKAPYWIFEEGIRPINIILSKRPNFSKKDAFAVSDFKLDVTNRFLYFILQEFILSHITMAIIQKDFFSTFQESLGGKEITCVEDFDITVFNCQYWFYKDLQRKALKANMLSKHIGLLKSFYLLLLGKPDGHDILTWRDGVDRNMLQNNKFDEHYENGFRPIPLNSLDPVPVEDRWLIMPNGAEALTTKLNAHEYRRLDFSPINDTKMKEAVKQWFWQDTMSIVGRMDHTWLIINFVNFIHDLRTKYHLNVMTKKTMDNDSFTAEEIFSYSMQAKVTSGTIQKLTAVRRFLQYVDDSGLYKVDPAAYQYLRARTSTSHSTAQDIPENDLLKLEARFRENAEGSYLQTLYYIIFHIALSTEFRISQILNLRVDCLVEGPSRNQHYVVSPTKVSKGEAVQQQITSYTKRFIERALHFTAKVRQQCTDSSLKQFLFLHNFYAHKYQVVNSKTFCEYFRRTCQDIGIHPFTPGSLRDTYMTRAVEFALKNGLSLLELSSITNHKNFDTTNNHYVANKIRDYLEATYMVSVGNVDIKGHILSKPDKDYGKEHLVDEACGYCAKETCNVFSGIDCPMCNGFVATIDRIPFYESKISVIDKKIIASKLSHDKEHLTTLKQLYVAYLERLYVLKEVSST